jgi:hypothetical protein
LLQDQLGEIEQGRTDGKFLDVDGQIARGQAILNQLLRFVSYLLMLSDAHDIVTELVIYQEGKEAHPLSERMQELVSQAGETKDSLIHHIADTALEARKVSLSTIHYLKDSLGIRSIP